MLATGGAKADIAIWAEYVEVTRGAKVITMSPALRDRYLRVPELSDQEIASASVDGEIEVRIESKTYTAIQRHRGQDLKGMALSAYEEDGLAAMVRTIEQVLGPVEITEDEDSGLPLLTLVTAVPVPVADERLPGTRAGLRAAIDDATKALRREASKRRAAAAKALRAALRASEPIPRDAEAARLNGVYRPDMTATELKALERLWDQYLG